MPLDTGAADVALNQLTSLPLGFIVAEPLKAAIQAQAIAAETTVDFIKAVGFEEVDGRIKALNLEFTFEDGSGTFQRVTVPVLAVVPIPFIVIDTVDIQFKAKIDASASQSSSESSSSAFSVGGSFTRSVTSSASAGLAKKKVQVSGSRTKTSTLNLYANYSSKKDSKATQDSKYSVEYTMDIQIHAEQGGMPQGMATVLNILQEGVAKRPLSTQVSIFGLSRVNKVTGTTLADTSFMVLVLDEFNEPVDTAVVELVTANGLIAPATAGTPAAGVYTLPLALESGATVTGEAVEGLTVNVTTGTSPDEEVTTVSREVVLTV